jgi:hypothetical protein
VGGLEGQAKRLHSFWPRGREFNSRRENFEKIVLFVTFLHFCTRCLLCARFHAQSGQLRHWHYSIKNLASMKMASCHRESKKVQKKELFDKARTYGCFLNQRHVELARDFHVLRGVECLPTHSLFEPRSMTFKSSPNIFHEFTPFSQPLLKIWHD